jgi:hypothetical protein
MISNRNACTASSPTTTSVQPVRETSWIVVVACLFLALFAVIGGESICGFFEQKLLGCSKKNYLGLTTFDA